MAEPYGAVADLFRQLTSSEQGLTSSEAQRRIADVGPNDPAHPAGAVGFRQLLGFLANPLVIVLLIASAVSAALGETISASIIVVIVGVSIILNFVQTYRSHRAAERLRESVAPTANALRDGAWNELARRQLVPGDVIRLTAGDRVPADARLLHARDLHIQQAALTGESMPVEKEAIDLAEPPGQLAEARNLVFLGTSVVSGTAMALVVATGPATAFGDIAARLSERPPETEFERGTRQFALFITRLVLFLVLFVLLASVAFHRPPLESLLFAVALAVGLTPESLPMITAVTLANGAVHMARRKVIVKHLEAIQNLGSMDVLCSDKTGTLTSGAMVLERRLDPAGQTAERPFLLAQLNAFHQTGIRSPLDTAILDAGPGESAAYAKIDEIPFDFERRRLSVVVERSGERLLITKGAPEGILTRCTAIEIAGQIAPIDPARHAECEATYQRLSAEGSRVLAVAYARVPAKSVYAAADERDLVLAGFVTFFDPPMPGVADALAALRRDGVEVKIITGDNELVARHLCGQVGLDATRLVRGDELETITDSALAAVAERTSVFARVSPAQKNRIIRALMHAGHVVGFLGDGINDAPSLHAADVGISVDSATDVAKDAADVILLARGLDVLHDGILEGRKAFGNVMKYLLMGTSSNFGNMLSMAGAAVYLPFLPMLAPQILLNNLLYDVAQLTIPTDNVDPSFTRTPQRWNIGTIRRFMLYIGPVSSVYDFVTFAVLLHVFRASEQLFHTGWFVESLATQTLVLFVIRTSGNPFRSRPSAPLTVTTILVVLVAIALPLTPLAGTLGFVPLPASYFLFLGGVAVTYLALVEVLKRRVMSGLAAT